jgi:hypothetical protein
MPDYPNTGPEVAAKLTIDLVDHQHTPDTLSDAILERLIELSDESQVNIWHSETGLNVESLAALFQRYPTGKGYRRSRLYANYELGRTERERGES